jgi:CRP/FNR family transcriptional regulator
MANNRTLRTNVYNRCGAQSTLGNLTKEYYLNGFSVFLASYPIKKFTRDEIVLRQDAEPSCVYFIKEGIIKSYNLTSKGEEKPIELNTQSDIFPIGWFLDKIHRSQYYYEAITDCTLYCLPKAELTVFLRNNSETMFQLLNRQVERSTHTQLRLNALEHSKAYDKVASTLHYFALRFGHDIRRNMVAIPLPLTQQDVANFTGLTRETVSAEFKKLTQQKILGHHQQEYVIYTNKLDELLDDSFERHFIR